MKTTLGRIRHSKIKAGEPEDRDMKTIQNETQRDKKN